MHPCTVWLLAGFQVATECRRSDARFSPARRRLQRGISCLPVSRVGLHLVVSYVPAIRPQTVS